MLNVLNRHRRIGPVLGKDKRHHQREVHRNPAGAGPGVGHGRLSRQTLFRSRTDRPDSRPVPTHRGDGAAGTGQNGNHRLRPAERRPRRPRSAAGRPAGLADRERIRAIAVLRPESGQGVYPHGAAGSGLGLCPRRLRTHGELPYNRLRAKIERDPARPEFIRTVWGVGYKFADFGGNRP